MTEMDRVSPYMLWRSPFFDVAWAPGSPFLRTPIRPDGPFPGWIGHDAGPWSTWMPLAPAEPLPRQGWKIHVSALPRNAATIIGAAARICREQGVVHKMLRTRELVLASQLKYADPVQSGKVLTCYPAAGQLEALALRLADELPELPHPAVQNEPSLAGSPVSLRYGAFRVEWLLDTAGTARPGVMVDGTMVEDRRGTADEQRATPCLPAALESRLEAMSPEDERLEISQVRLLHRSNAGGVYSAMWRGRKVVLKEARDHCGLDLDEQPASIRLRHEWQALRRLAGTGTAPEPLDYLRVGSSEFLIMSLVTGPSLVQKITTAHPLVAPDADRDAYLEWLEGVHHGLDHLVGTMAKEGVVHGDLHPGNLIDAADGLTAIDFESCTINGQGTTTNLHHPLFSRSHDEPDADADRLAAARMVGVLTVPSLMSTGQSETVREEILRVGDLELHTREGHEATTTPALTASELAEATIALADPSRPERLFPGDPVQFQRHGAGLGLLHGSARVLLALHLLGYEPDEELVGIFCEQIAGLGTLPRGMANGAEGMAWALLRMGRLEEAERLIERCIARGLPDARCPWWANGTAGVAAMLSRAGSLLNREDLADTARAQYHLTVEAMGSGQQGRAGLLSGWAGGGLALFSSERAERTAQHALAALRLESRQLALDGCMLTAWQVGKRVPYLGEGGIATALLARELMPEISSEQDRENLSTLVTAGMTSCRSPHLLEAGLMQGRAGLLVGLCALDGNDPMVQEHSRRLRWGCTRVTDPSGRPRTVVLGRTGMRASLDLASGCAGVALSLAPDPWEVVSTILALT